MKNTKDKIIDTAWQLFRIKGFDNTTVNNIIQQSGTSKGSFYYYFSSKDDLLSTLSELLDKNYLEIEKRIPKEMHNFDKLIYISIEIHKYMEDNIEYELLASMYSSQLTTKSNRHLLDKNRVYYNLVSKIIEQGQKNNEIISHKTVNEIFEVYAMLERGFVYTWCLSQASYSLANYCQDNMPLLLNFLKK